MLMNKTTKTRGPHGTPSERQRLVQILHASESFSQSVQVDGAVKNLSIDELRHVASLSEKKTVKPKAP